MFLVIYLCCSTTLLLLSRAENLDRKYNILFVNAPGSDSHRKSVYPLAKKLGQLGHRVTLLVDGIEGVTKKPGAKELEHVEAEYLFTNVSAEWLESRTGNLDYMVWSTDHTSPIAMIFPWSMFGEFTKLYMEQNGREIESKLLKKRWDLVMVDALFTPFGILIALLTNSTMASVHTTAVTNAGGFRRPMPVAWSYYPTLFLPTPHYDHRNFFDRLNSFCTDLSELLVNGILVDPILFWQHSKYHRRVSSYTLNHRSQILLVGFPSMLDYERPQTRDMAPFVGSCKQKTALKIEDPEIEKMIEDPTSKGTILVAFGHMVKWKMAPEMVKQNFVEALNMLKDYRIIWQYSEDVDSLKIDSHVRCMPWIPQEALLMHPKTRLFISHGGLKSITETICAGVPALVIPFFAEQIRNAHLLVKRGSGVVLSKFNLTSSNIFAESSRILNDPNFSRQIRKLKVYFNDQLIPSVDNGAFWTEFVIRHQNEKNFRKFFRLRETNMSWIEIFMIDIFVCFFMIPFFSTLFIVRRVRKYFRF